MKLVIVLLLVCIFSSYANATREVTIAGYGGNDVFAMNQLLRETLVDELEARNLLVNYFAVESDYPKYILNALSSGNAPDAFYVNSDVALSWINTGQLQPLPDFLIEARKDIHPVLTSVYEHQGNLFAIPKDMNALALVYNLDVFDDAGVAYPSNDDDWSGLKSKLKKVVETLGEEGVTGLCITPEFNRFAPFALATGWQPFNENGRTVLDNNFERAFNFYLSLHKEGLAKMPSDLGQNWGGGCFAIERSAVTIEGSWVAGYLRDKSPNLLYDSVLVPKDPQTNQRGNLLFTAGWAINISAKNLQATIDVVSMLTNAKAQSSILSSGLAIPSSLALENHEYFASSASKNRLAKTILKGTQVENVMPFSFGAYGNNWMEPIQIALSSVMLGQIDEQQAIDEAQASYDAMYERLKGIK